MLTIIILFFFSVSQKLPENFASVEVKVVDCPNLTEEPFRLTTPGK